MNSILMLARALGDESRIRAIMMLRSGELCVCQIIKALKLAPATVSKHMSILHEVGIVERHKRGRWAYYRLAGRKAAPAVSHAMKWLVTNVKMNAQIRRDMKILCCVRKADPTELTGCYGMVASSTTSANRASKATGTTT